MTVARETFNTVKAAQIELLTNIFYKLEQENDILATDEDTRNTYLHLVADSLCGIDKNYHFILIYKNETFTVGNLAYYLKEMAFLRFSDPTNRVMPLPLKGYASVVDVPVSEVWKALRKSCYMAMADALTLAFTASTERFSGAMNAFEFGLGSIKEHRKKLAERFSLGVSDNRKEVEPKEKDAATIN